MTRAIATRAVPVTALILFVIHAGQLAVAQGAPTAAVASPATAGSTTSGTPKLHPAWEDNQGFIYGRLTTIDDSTSQGRLRFGGNEEAFWGDYFNGTKSKNAWASNVPDQRLPSERHKIQIFGFTLMNLESPLDLGRPFMARFGDITRIEAVGRNIRVTLKSGTVFDLDRFAADDLADGVRVWDGSRGVLDFDEWRIRTIELFPAPAPEAVARRLHGTVGTRQGDFTGFVQWNRAQGVSHDTLDGQSANNRVSLRFDTIRSIARGPQGEAQVTLRDGREMVLSNPDGGAHSNRGVYVDDRRYGRVLVSWDAFERVDFSPGGSGPAYGDFPAGHRLTGTVTTRAGRRLPGRLVYDLDESETTETLDAPLRGVNYTIPFGLIAELLVPANEGPGNGLIRVTLHSGEALQLEPAGDLGKGNAGVLIFVDGRPHPEYVTWADIQQVNFDLPPAMYPPLAAGQGTTALRQPARLPGF